MQDNGDRNSARNVAFLITDGQSNNREDTMKQAKRLKDKGIHLFVAGVGECCYFDLYALFSKRSAHWGLLHIAVKPI